MATQITNEELHKLVLDQQKEIAELKKAANILTRRLHATTKETTRAKELGRTAHIQITAIRKALGG